MIMQIDLTRFLLVEDDPNDVELVRLAFANHNLLNLMDVAIDGEEAVNYLIGSEHHPPAPLPRFVLLDLKLPKLSGLEVLARIRNHPRTRSLVVVAMTSSAEDRDLDRCYQLGVNSYVVKPLDFEQFVTITRQVGLYWMLLNSPPRGV